MALPVRYTLARACGWGRIVNIGSGGALLTIDQPVMAGQRVELCIGWPVLWHEKVHLNLVANGVILRAGKGPRCGTVRKRCHFRTASAEFRRRALPELRGAALLHG